MNVLIAVDLREDAPDAVVLGALPWIQRLGAEASVVFTDPYGEFPVPSAEQPARDRAALEVLLRLLPEDHRGDAVLLSGAPERSVVEHAVNFDLLVVGAGVPSVAEFFLGSVAARILRYCPVPVWLTRGEAPVGEPPRLLLAVALDGHEQAVVAQAGRQAEALGARLDVMHVDEEAEPVYVPDSALNKAIRAAWQAERAALVDRVEQLLPEIPSGARGVAFAVSGTAWQLIAEQAVGYDAVVVATRGLDSVSRLFLGSVAERLVRAAPGPVLILRMDPEHP